MSKPLEAGISALQGWVVPPALQLAAAGRVIARLKSAGFSDDDVGEELDPFDAAKRSIAAEGQPTAGSGIERTTRPRRASHDSS